MKEIVHSTKTKQKSPITLMINPNIAKGLSDPHRIKILDLLYHQELSTKELMVHLKRSKSNIAMTTIRHHLSILRKIGLIRVSKTKEVKGTLVKYYVSTTKILAYEEIPLHSFSSSPLISSFYKEHRENLKFIYAKIYKVIENWVLKGKDSFIKLIPQAFKNRCKICNVFHYIEYLIFAIINMIITKILRRLLTKL